MSNVKTTKFVRKPMVVDAVRVTEENFHDVAAWCQGTIRTADKAPITWMGDAVPDLEGLHIHVRVQNPKDEKQTQARIGDWVLYMDRGGYKVFTDRAFQRSFDLKETKVAEVSPPDKFLADDPFDGVPRVNDDQIQMDEELQEKALEEPAVEDAAQAAEEVGLTVENPIEMTEQERIAQMKAEAREEVAE